MSSRPELTDLLSALARILPEWCDRWYLFGAQAVSVWGLPRLTADVDVTARLRSEDHGGLVAAMRIAGFDSRVRDVDDFVRRTRVLPFVHRATQIPLDIVLAGPGLEDEFLERARAMDFGGVVLPVISAEDLLITKIVAGRPKDLEDIRGILQERLPELDLLRVRRILDLLDDALGRRDLRPLFDEQVAASKKEPDSR